MKHMKRANIYKNYNGTNQFDPETFLAVSYNWWIFVKDFDGVKVFNTYSYSPTTCKHQSNMRGLLQDLGERVDYYWELECPGGLQDLQSGVDLYEIRIDCLKASIARPRTHKKKNEERKALISQYETKIEMLKKLQGVS